MEQIYSEALLVHLSRVLGCNYLSDLHRECWHDSLLEIVNAIPTEAYTLKEWSAATQYIAETDLEFISAADARRHLLEHVS